MSNYMDMKEYYMTTQCRLLRLNNIYKKELLRDIKKFEEPYEVDERLGLVSFGESTDLSAYIRYLNTMARLSLKEEASIGSGNRFMTMLDMGYMPVIAPPTYMNEKISGLLFSRVAKSGVGYVERDMVKLNGTIINASTKDVWCSRKDMSDFLNCDLLRVNIAKFIGKVML